MVGEMTQKQTLVHHRPVLHAGIHVCTILLLHNETLTWKFFAAWKLACRSQAIVTNEELEYSLHPERTKALGGHTFDSLSRIQFVHSKCDELAHWCELLRTAAAADPVDPQV
jgi:hypothetical protein